MSTITLSGFNLGPFNISGAGTNFIVNKGASLMVGGALSGGAPGTIIENVTNPLLNHDNHYTINGTVIGYQMGMYLVGANDTVAIGDDGIIQGVYGVILGGAGSKLTNNGHIIGEVSSPGTGAGIYVVAQSNISIDNHGLISGDSAVLGTGGGIRKIINEHDGVMVGNSYGIYGGALGTVDIINHGYISGKAGYGVIWGAGSAHVINDGTIKGQVVFSSGDDLLDNRGGTLSNLTVIGGGGDDTLIVDDNKHFLQESAAGGTDTIKSTVSYKLPTEVERLYLIGKANTNGTGSDGDNQIFGNAGNNTLSGKGGTDHLYGGKGADKLLGGTGTDMFHFNTGDGHDRIEDFHHLEDKINLSGWAGVNSLTKVLADAHNQGANVLIEHGTDSLLLIGVHKGDLTVDDFAF